jgi:hypothetical protein
MSARLPSSQPHPRSGNHRAAESPPVGLKRVLHRLPFAVLTCENYRRLVELLADPGTGKLLVQHTETDLNDSTIEAIASVPAALRS